MVSLFAPSALALVALGGAAGAVGRHVAQVLAGRIFGVVFPWGTLGVNVAGSLAMGLLAALLLDRGGVSRATLLLMTGVLGGFTTYSTFSLETVRLVETGEPARAAAYALASVGLTVGGCWAGLLLGRAL
jgi:CrcB protein